MKVVSCNKENTVGIITDPKEVLHIGTFTPKLIKEWMKLVYDMYGDEQDIHLFIRKSDIVDGYCIYASSNGDNPFVAIVGRHPADGSDWEQKYLTK